jgi:ribose transport system ATP-binding protein
MTVDGRTYNAADMTPGRAMKAGVVLLPANRQEDGAIFALSVTDNVTMNVLDQFYDKIGLRRGLMTERARSVIKEVDVRPPDPKLTFSSLSGGNQQKALLAKWLQVKPRVFLAHEPTLGVDVGARRQISILLEKATEQGLAIICASSDYEELASICDRVLILAHGKVVGELAGPELTKDRIAEQCLTAGGKTDS